MFFFFTVTGYVEAVTIRDMNHHAVTSSSFLVGSVIRTDDTPVWEELKEKHILFFLEVCD